MEFLTLEGCVPMEMLSSAVYPLQWLGLVTLCHRMTVKSVRMLSRKRK